MGDAMTHFGPLGHTFEVHLCAAMTHQRLLVVAHGEVEIEEAHDQVVNEFAVHEALAHRINRFFKREVYMLGHALMEVILQIAHARQST